MTPGQTTEFRSIGMVLQDEAHKPNADWFLLLSYENAIADENNT